MALELFGGLVAEELHAVASLDERQALCDQALELDRADFRAVLLLLAALLRRSVVVEIALCPVGGAMEQVDGRPEQVAEVRFEARVLQRRDQRIEGCVGALCGGETWTRVGR